MATEQTTSRRFVPGTAGWTAADLDNPRIERRWLSGGYEIVEGVLTLLPALSFACGEVLVELLFRVMSHLDRERAGRGFATGVDIVMGEARVVRADAVYLNAAAKGRQQAAAVEAGRRDSRRTHILIPPSLVIESVSPGHEQHDRETKRRWYAEFGVSNYWILDASARSLECMVLDGKDHRLDASGRDAASVRPTLFPGLAIPLGSLWEE